MKNKMQISSGSNPRIPGEHHDDHLPWLHGLGLSKPFLSIGGGQCSGGGAFLEKHQKSTISCVLLRAEVTLYIFLVARCSATLAFDFFPLKPRPPIALRPMKKKRRSLAASSEIVCMWQVLPPSKMRWSFVCLCLMGVRQLGRGTTNPKILS